MVKRNHPGIRIARKLRMWFRRLTLCRPLTQIYDRLSDITTLGDRGEREAERFLLRKGWVLVQRGYSDNFGEIDLIMIDGETVVFVEVKSRTTDDGTSPAEAVDEVKIRRITKTAQGFIRHHGLEECRLRFDVIAIRWIISDQPPTIDHYRAAFEPAGEFQIF